MVHYWLHELAAVSCNLGVRSCSLFSIIASTTELLKKKLHHEDYKISEGENKISVYFSFEKKKSKLFCNSVAILHVFQKNFLTFMFSPMPTLVQGLPPQK